MHQAGPTLEGMSHLSLVALLAAAAWMPTSPVRVVLAFDPRLPAAISRLAAAEAAAVWKIYGVTVVGPDAMTACLPVDCLITARLAVVIEDHEDAGEQARLVPLGAIRFRDDGVPEKTILLRYRALTTLGLSTVTVGDLHEPQWPPAMRHLVVGRIVGRVVAHEIGHWLLQRREHSPSGLMRAIQPTADLAEPARVKFTLLPADINRLREVVARRRSEQPSD